MRTTSFECCFGGIQCEQLDCRNTRRESCEHCSQQLGRSLRFASTVLAGFLRGFHAEELGVHGWHQQLLARLEGHGRSGLPLARPRDRCFDGALLPDTSTFPGSVIHIGTFAHLRTVGARRSLAIGLARRDTYRLCYCLCARHRLGRLESVARERFKFSSSCTAMSALDATPKNPGM